MRLNVSGGRNGGMDANNMNDNWLFSGDAGAAVCFSDSEPRNLLGPVADFTVAVRQIIFSPDPT